MKRIERIEKNERRLRKLRVIRLDREIGGDSSNEQILRSLLNGVSDRRGRSVYEDGKIHCSARYRSIPDLYRMFIYYRPDTTLIEFLRVLFTAKNIHGWHCGNIGRWVFLNYQTSGRDFNRRIIATYEETGLIGLGLNDLISEVQTQNDK